MGIGCAMDESGSPARPMNVNEYDRVPYETRPAEAADVPAIEAVVRRAYTVYLARMDRPPAPMLDDYRARVAAGGVFVIEMDGRLGAVLVLVPMVDHLLLDNVAVDPACQGKGLGRALVAFAEREAARRGFGELRLYTNAVMTENVGLYAHLGFEETHRGEEAGYSRIFMRKRVAGDAARRG